MTAAKRRDSSVSKDDDPRAQARMAYFSAGVSKVASVDEATAAELKKLIRKDEGLRDLTKALKHASSTYLKVAAMLREGKLARDEAQVRISKAFAPLRSGKLVSVRRKLENMLPPRSRSHDADALEALFDKQQRDGSTGWSVDGDWTGPHFYKPHGRTDVDDHRRDVGDPRDPSPPGPATITDCGGRPYTLRREIFTTSGPGLSGGGVTTDLSGGKAAADLYSELLVLGGSAAYGEAFLGREVQWSAGFRNMRVTADFDVSANFWAMAIGLSGAGAGCDLVLDVALNGNPSTRVIRPLGAAVAPVLWWTSINIASNFTVEMNVPIPSTAGSAQILAGVVGHTAVGGVFGAGASTTINGTLSRVCILLQ